MVVTTLIKVRQCGLSVWTGRTIYRWQGRVARILIAGLMVNLECARAEPTEMPDPLEAGWQGQRVCELLRETDRLRALRCVFPPGAGHERHFHAPHFGYALSGGAMKITDASGTRMAELVTGSHFVSDGIDWHEVLNVGASTVEYLIIESKN